MGNCILVLIENNSPMLWDVPRGLAAVLGAQQDQLHCHLSCLLEDEATSWLQTFLAHLPA